MVVLSLSLCRDGVGEVRMIHSFIKMFEILVGLIGRMNGSDSSKHWNIGTKIQILLTTISFYVFLLRGRRYKFIYCGV